MAQGTAQRPVDDTGDRAAQLGPAGVGGKVLCVGNTRLTRPMDKSFFGREPVLRTQQDLHGLGASGTMARQQHGRNWGNTAKPIPRLANFWHRLPAAIMSHPTASSMLPQPSAAPLTGAVVPAERQAPADAVEGPAIVRSACRARGQPRHPRAENGFRAAPVMVSGVAGFVIGGTGVERHVDLCRGGNVQHFERRAG